MRSQSIRVVPKSDDAHAVAPGTLVHLGDVDDEYMIADPNPDMRGWEVALPDGRRVGKVDDVIVDTSSMTAKYLEVKVHRDVLLGDEDRWVLVPVDSVRFDDEDTRVIIDHLPAAGLAAAPRHRERLPTAEEERLIYAYFEVLPAGAARG